MTQLAPGKASPLTQEGLDRALEDAGLTPADCALLWTVVDVETAGVTQGFGFRSDRRPQVLFERHKFREFTRGVFDSTAPDLSGPAGQPYGPVAAQMQRVEDAIDLCVTAGLGREPAFAAASWGMGQVMGFNHAQAGYSSAEDMALAMFASEDVQLGAMGRFLKANGLASKMRAKQWAAFAKTYNGSAYARFKYDVKLDEAYARFSSGSNPDLRVRSAQAALLLLGYAPGKIDGVLGRRTKDALTKFRQEEGLPQDQQLDDATYRRLVERAQF